MYTAAKLMINLQYMYKNVIKSIKIIEIAVKITVIVFWILAVSVFIAFLIVFGVLGGRKKHKHEGLYSRESGASVSAKNKWERR
jgi:hypothetical protein